MTDVNPDDPDPDESAPTGPKVTDKRRLDPVTGAVRDGYAVPGASREDVFTEGVDVPETGELPEGVAGDDIHPDTTLAADLTRDLQRLQAEYVNYKRRVDRDRELHRAMAIGGVIEAFLPVLDDIQLARQHGDLEGGPFAAIADKLEGTMAKFGVERFGQPGDAFDPTVHEALMNTDAELAEGTEVTTVVQVMQPGYKIADRLIRPARVAVADPQTDPQT